MQQLLADLEHDLPFVQGRALRSIFFGGGTPSIFSAQAIAAILQGVQQRIPFAEDIEITLEANPGTAEAEKFVGFRTAGVNRLSIGVQSFSENHLRALGRIHNGAEAARIHVDELVEQGAELVGIDVLVVGHVGGAVDHKVHIAKGSVALIGAVVIDSIPDT